MNLPYCTANVKASVGAAAHLAGPLGAPKPVAPWLHLLLSRRLPAAVPYGPGNIRVN